jgi:hypothetical protein
MSSTAELIAAAVEPLDRRIADLRTQFERARFAAMLARFDGPWTDQRDRRAVADMRRVRP